VCVLDLSGLVQDRVQWRVNTMPHPKNILTVACQPFDIVYSTYLMITLDTFRPSFPYKLRVYYWARNVFVT
jgi:hypothetical protein